MTCSFDRAVLIGRFQPFHRGHAALLGKALASAPQVTVVLGSALGARTSKNPFTWTERAEMIAATLGAADRARVRFIPVRDYYDSGVWSKAVEAAVQGGDADRIVLVGHSKDASSYYLKLFPRWTYLDAGAQGGLCATELRRLFYAGEPAGIATAMASLPEALHGRFAEWLRSPECAHLREEYLAIQESLSKWGRGPFITLDAVVEACGRVLLVRRGRHPGKGLWALPGGFLEGDERLVDGALRELLEETGLDLKQWVGGYELKGVAVFDHPERSLRGRTITHAHYFRVGGEGLPEVAGDDDAAEARWIPVSEIQGMEGEFFDDHFHILGRFLAIQTGRGC